MSYSHRAPYYFGKLVTDGPGFPSAASDAVTDAATSSDILVDDDGEMILTPSASTIRSAHVLSEVQSICAITPTGSLSYSLAPSTTSETATMPYVDIETRLKNEFDKLNFHDKHRALAAVGKFQPPGSGPSSEAETEILTKTDAAKNDDNHDTRGAGTHQDSTKPILADWQALCKAVGITDDKMPVSITQCKKTLKGYNANLYDVYAAIRNGTVAQTFPSIAALSRYSKHEGKVMSKAVASKDPLLKVMLRELFRGDKVKGEGKK